jgi:hypothetical protein
MNEDEKLSPWQRFKAGFTDAAKEAKIELVTPTSDEKKPARPWDLLNKNVGRVEDTVAEERLAICKECPKLIKKLNTCRECGCFMVEKVKLPNAFCPIGKWQTAPAAPIDL